MKNNLKCEFCNSTDDVRKIICFRNDENGNPQQEVLCTCCSLCFEKAQTIVEELNSESHLENLVDSLLELEKSNGTVPKPIMSLSKEELEEYKRKRKLCGHR